MHAMPPDIWYAEVPNISSERQPPTHSQDLDKGKLWRNVTGTKISHCDVSVKLQLMCPGYQKNYYACKDRLPL